MLNANKVYDRQIIQSNGDYLLVSDAHWNMFIERHSQ
ncbi:hypothetical protein [Klebsiella oxytoca]